MIKGWRFLYKRALQSKNIENKRVYIYITTIYKIKKGEDFSTVELDSI